jgi:hypothetical protein
LIWLVNDGMEYGLLDVHDGNQLLLDNGDALNTLD